MSTENQQISQAVRSGRYFEDARSWFKAVYVGPVSERTFFLIIALLSVVIFLIAMVALLGFMPLTERPAAYIKAPGQIDEMIPRLVKIKEGKESINDALRRFLVTRYVIARESFSASTFDRNARFVYGNSAENVYAAFQAQSNPKNADSYAAKLGASGAREIAINSVNISNDAAIVQFTATIIGAEDNAKSRWTAKLNYTYNDVAVTSVIDNDGNEHLETTQPQFQVTNYAIESR